MVSETKKDKEKYEVIDVSIQTEPAIKDVEEEQIFNIYSAICKIMNDIHDIKKQIT